MALDYGLLSPIPLNQKKKPQNSKAKATTDGSLSFSQSKHFNPFLIFLFSFLGFSLFFLISPHFSSPESPYFYWVSIDFPVMSSSSGGGGVATAASTNGTSPRPTGPTATTRRRVTDLIDAYSADRTSNLSEAPSSIGEEDHHHHHHNDLLNGSILLSGGPHQQYQYHHRHGPPTELKRWGKRSPFGERTKTDWEMDFNQTQMGPF